MTNAQPAATAAPPLEGKRPLLYYGWWIVIGAAVAQFVAMGQNQATNLILGPMTADLGWTRTEFILPTSIGVLFSGVIGFFIGAQVDRRGARPLLIIGTIISSTALILLAYVTELWQFWLLRGVLLVAGNVMVGNLVVNSTISKWFVDRRGWAISMAALGVSGWSVLGTQLLRPVVDDYGWRVGWLTLGVGSLVLLLVAMVMRRQPEDHGLLPDGRRASDGDTAGGRASIQRAADDFANSFTRGQAARTPQLWLLVLAFGFALTGMTALFAHMLQFFVDAGFTRTEAAFFYSTQGAFSLLAKFVWGSAMQRFPARFLVALAFTIAGASTLGLVLTVQDAPWQVVAALSATWGLGTGGMIPLSEFVWASYFGRRHIGAVRGLGMPFTVMLTSFGPLYASRVFDVTGSYDIAMFTFVGLWFAGALLILTARRPRHEADRNLPLAHRLRQPGPPPHTAMAAVAGGERPPQPAVAEEPVPIRAAVEVAAPPAAALDVPAPLPPEGAASPAAAFYPPPLPEALPALEPAPEEPPTDEPPPLEVVTPLRRRPPRSYMGEASSAAPYRPLPSESAPRPRQYMGEPTALPPRPGPLDDRPANASVGAAPSAVAPAAPHASPVPSYMAREDGASGHVTSGTRGTNAPNGVNAATGVRAAPAPAAAPAYTSPPRAPSRPLAADSRGVPPRHGLPRPMARARAVERPPRRDLERVYGRGRYVPQTTTSAVLAGVATSLVATAALWFITRPDGKRRS